MILDNYNIIYTLGNLFMAYVIYKFIHIFYSDCKVNVIIECMSYIVYFILITITHVFFKIPVIVMIVNLLLLFLLSLLYEGDIKKAVLSVTIIYFSLMIIETILAFLTSTLNLNVLLPFEYESGFGIIAIRITSFVFVLIAEGFKNVKDEYPLPYAYWFSLLVVPLSTLIMLFVIFLNNSLSRGLLLLSMISALAINIFTFYLYDKISSLLVSQINKHIAERQRQYYEYQMQMMKSTYANTRILRHDLNNKLSPLHNLALAGNSEELAVQLAKLMDICYENKEYSKSGNSTIDSIINFKLQHAEAKGITVTTDIIIPAELSISTFDIAVVIGNLVDNALEATIKTTDRWIDIKIKYTNSVYLKVGLSVFYDGKNLLDHTERGYPPRCSVSRYKNESNKGIGFGKRLWHFILWGRGIMVISRSRNKEGCVVKKAILSGLGASIIFYIVCGILSGTLADIIFFTGDPFIMSFHQYTYMGLVILCGIIVTCTVFLNTKLDNLKNELLNNENRK